MWESEYYCGPVQRPGLVWPGRPVYSYRRYRPGMSFFPCRRESTTWACFIHLELTLILCHEWYIWIFNKILLDWEWHLNVWISVTALAAWLHWICYRQTDTGFYNTVKIWGLVKKRGIQSWMFVILLSGLINEWPTILVGTVWVLFSEIFKTLQSWLRVNPEKKINVFLTFE